MTEELELISKAQKGNSDAMETLIRRSKPWAFFSIRTFHYMFHADLKQQVILGLIEAIKRFNPSHAVSLQAYASHYVRMQILKFIYYNTNMSTLNYRTRKKVIAELSPQVEILLEHIAPTVVNIEDILTRVQIAKRIEAALSTLSERERAIVKKHVMEESCTLEVLGKQFNITRERIRQLENEALKKLYFRLKPLQKNLDVYA